MALTKSAHSLRLNLSSGPAGSFASRIRTSSPLQATSTQVLSEQWLLLRQDSPSLAASSTEFPSPDAFSAREHTLRCT